MAILLVFFVTAEQALDEAWEFAAPDYAVYASLAMWLMLLEALRRAAGWPLCLIAGAFSILPVVTEFMPGPLNGLPSTWAETASYHLLSIESVFGLPFRAFADLVIGFVVFGVVLQFTGGGQFFEFGFRDFGSPAGWACQSCHRIQWPDGFHERQCGDQCADHRPTHHTGHAEIWYGPGSRRRR